MKWMLAIALWMCSCLLFGQGDTVHYTKIGGPSDEVGIALFEASDSTFWICVNSGQSSLNSDAAIHLLEVDQDGAVIQSRGYGTYATDRAESCDLDSALTVIAGISNGNAGRYQGVLYFVDSESGELKKEVYRDLDGSWSHYAYVKIIGDTVVAFLEAVDSSTTTVAIERFDRFGNFISSSSPEFLESTHIESLVESQYVKGTYLAVGYRQTAAKNGVLMRLNGALDTLWTKELELSGNDGFEAVTELTDSSIVAVGYAEGFFLEDEDILVMRFDTNGLPLDTAIQGYGATSNNRDDRAHDVFSIGDTIYMIGFTRTYGEGGMEVFYSRLDRTLFDIGTSTTFGTNQDEDCYDFLMHRGSLYGVGFSAYQAAGTRDVLFWRRDSLTTTVAIKSITSQSYTLQQSVLDIRSPQQATSERVMDVMSESGRVSIGCLLEEGCDPLVIDLQGRMIWRGNIDFNASKRLELKPAVYLLQNIDSSNPYTTKFSTIK